MRLYLGRSFSPFLQMYAIIRGMKTIGVIAEFNPFHNGHAWFLSEARRRAEADRIIVVMSGNFVQRGAPAILDKYVRAGLALAGGADLVLELPAACAASGARHFAEGAVTLLEALGCVDELWFGSEEGELAPFVRAADVLAREPEAFSAALQAQMAAGKSFPAARADALAALTREAALPQLSASFLAGPNNILGLEYCLALARAGSGIRPQTLPRMGSAYHDESLQSAMASATAIRNALEACREPAAFDRCRAETVLRCQVPSSCMPVLHRALQHSLPLFTDDFSSMLQYQLLREDRASLSGYLDVSADLAGRILHLLPGFRSWTDFAASLKTRNLTRTQTDRALLHILLGITPDSLQRALHPDCAHMLGFRADAAALLTEIKKRGRLPLATGSAAYRLCREDLFVSRLYEARCAVLSGRPAIHEFSRPVIRL